MNARPYKFLVLPVVQILDDDGDVIGEQQPDGHDVVYGTDGLRQYADTYAAALDAQLVAAQNGQPTGRND